MDQNSFVMRFPAVEVANEVVPSTIPMVFSIKTKKLVKNLYFSCPFKGYKMVIEQNFEDIRPYYDHETFDVLQKMIKDPLFMKLANHLWPTMTYEEVVKKAAKVNTAMGFQLEFMHPAIRTIVSRSSTGLTCSGFEKLDRNTAYLFVANHRDILLDSAILQILLVENGFQTSEITFGNNLMEAGFITDFGRINRMFTVQREGTSRELYDISKRLSSYIRHTITDKKVSVWIAQRNGQIGRAHV